MFKRIYDINKAAGCSKKDSIVLSYRDVAAVFGEAKFYGDEKVSGEWIFEDTETGEVFTLYDWKSTSLYSDSLPSVSEFRESGPVTFNIGSRSTRDSVEKFKWFLVYSIRGRDTISDNKK